MWVVVVIYGMGIEQLPRVESVVARVLQPYWKKVIVEPAFHELGIAASSLSVS